MYLNLDKFVSNWSVVSTNSHQQVIHTLQKFTIQRISVEKGKWKIMFFLFFIVFAAYGCRIRTAHLFCSWHEHDVIRLCETQSAHSRCWIVWGGSCDYFPAYIMLDILGFQVTTWLANFDAVFLLSLMSELCLLYLVLNRSPVSPV